MPPKKIAKAPARKPARRRPKKPASSAAAAQPQIISEAPEVILDALGSLERAMAGHAEWFKNWHLSVILRRTPGEAVQQTSRTSAFGRWYYGSQPGVFMGNPAFVALGTNLERMHEHARMLAKAVDQRQMVPASDYDLFMTTVLQFTEQVRSLQYDAWNSLANVDPLTGIRNRQSMLAQLDIERERARRSSNPCTIGMVDIDHFKKINDNHGHATGDVVLKTVAEMLAHGVRPYDQIYRYGGEEFLICLPNTDAPGAKVVLERLRKRLESSDFPFGKEKGRVTASFGIAQVATGDGIETSIERADRALYAAKLGGRNRIEVWHPSLG